MPSLLVALTKWVLGIMVKNTLDPLFITAAVESQFFE